MDKMSLFWKWVLERTFIHKEAESMPGFKAFKDRITIFLGGDVVGYRLKPFEIWPSENSRAFKHIIKHTCQWTTGVTGNHGCQEDCNCQYNMLFQHALLNCFANKMKKYYLENDIPLKILLIVANAPDILLLPVIFNPVVS